MIVETARFPEHAHSTMPTDTSSAGTSAPGLALPWIVRLRYGLIAGEILLVGMVYLAFEVSLPFAGLGSIIAFQALSNGFLRRRGGMLDANPQHWVGAAFLVDTLSLTVILTWTGGPLNPFSLLYLVQITFSAVILNKVWTWALGLQSIACFGTLFWLAPNQPAFELHSGLGEVSVHLVGMWVAFATAALLISFFIGKVSEEARQKEQEILEMQRRLAKNQRLESLVTLAAGAAHEISTPLATIAVTAKEVEHDAVRRFDDVRLTEEARLIRSEVDHCRRILERMSAEGADPLGEAPAVIDATDLLMRVRERFPNAQERIDVSAQAAGAGGVLVPIGATIEALAALVKNALDASSPEKIVRLEYYRNTSRQCFLVRDDGCGISAEVMARISEPFFTTKPTGHGMGLGTFLAHRFAQRLGGELRFDSAPEQGCTAVLELPVMPNIARHGSNS